MVNTLFGVQVAALAELLAMARREQFDPARAAAIVGSTPAASPAAKGVMAGNTLISCGYFYPCAEAQHL